MGWPGIVDFKAFWRLCFFYQTNFNRELPGTTQHRLGVIRKLPPFDEWTIMAVQNNAPADLSPSIVALIEILMLSSQLHKEQPSFSRLPQIKGSLNLPVERPWSPTHGETYCLILVEFLERCAAPSMPYKACETLELILRDHWPGPNDNFVLERRFASAVLALVDLCANTSGSDPGYCHADLVHKLLVSSIFMNMGDQNLPRPIRFEDPTAAKLILDALGKFLDIASEDIVHIVRLIVASIRLEHEHDEDVGRDDGDIQAATVVDA
jgi:hypothetical protein